MHLCSRPLSRPLSRSSAIAHAALLLLLAGLIDTAPAAADNWPGFLGPDRDGVVQAGELLTDWPDDGPDVRWTQPIGPGFGGSAIVGGKVYLLDRDGITGDSLKTFDLKTGELLGEIPYDAPGRLSYHGSRSTPSVTDTHAFTVGPLGHVTAFDLANQRVAWQKNMQDDFGALPPKWGWSQSPLVLGDLVIVAPMADDPGLIALDQQTGRVAWRSDSIGNEGYSSPRLMTLAGQPQIVTLTATLVTGVDPATGKVLWAYDGIPVKRGIPTPAAVDDDRIFITAGYDAGSALLEITRQGDRFGLKELKRDTTHGGQIHAPLPVGQHLYVNLNTNENLRQRGKHADGLACFDRAGNLVWKNNNSPDINRGAVLAVGEHLLTLGGEDGVLRLVKADPAGYHELASAKVFKADQSRNMIWGTMSFVDGYLILRSQDELKCLDLRVR